MHGDQSPRTLNLVLTQPKEAVKSMMRKRSVRIQNKKLEMNPHRMEAFAQLLGRIITSNLLEDVAKNDKYAITGKGFSRVNDSSDDSILIVDPGWDDYCLQELKLNRPVPLCPEVEGPACESICRPSMFIILS
ncbi:hypothetical protein Tco_0206173 [Tanacetum coccineum]